VYFVSLHLFNLTGRCFLNVALNSHNGYGRYASGVVVPFQVLHQEEPCAQHKKVWWLLFKTS